MITKPLITTDILLNISRRHKNREIITKKNIHKL